MTPVAAAACSVGLVCVCVQVGGAADLRSSSRSAVLPALTRLRNVRLSQLFQAQQLIWNQSDDLTLCSLQRE